MNTSENKYLNDLIVEQSMNSQGDRNLGYLWRDDVSKNVKKR